MDVERFLVRQGWKKGEGLRPGSIKKPLLVKHRKNNKGLGFNPQVSEGWWERVFDSHLKSLGVSNGSNVTFEVDEDKRRRDTSPLYASFLSGGVLEGSIKTKTKIEGNASDEHGSRARKSKEKNRSKEHKSGERKSKEHKSPEHKSPEHKAKKSNAEKSEKSRSKESKSKKSKSNELSSKRPSIDGDDADLASKKRKRRNPSDS